jgi:hypothetical protein
MFCVLAINRKTGNGATFGPYETEADAGAAANAGRRRGGNVAWFAEPLHAPDEGGDPHGAFVVRVSESDRVMGPFSTSVAARAWMRPKRSTAIAVTLARS